MNEKIVGETIYLYTDHAEPTYIPNQYSLSTLLGAGIVRMTRGKRRYEHEYFKTAGPGNMAHYEYMGTVDFGEVKE